MAKKSDLKVGSYQSLPLRELEPHPLAQRKFDARYASDLAARFDPASMGTITVAETPRGKRWVVDGQHRRAAAIQWLNGDLTQCVDCKVIPVADDAEAAELFLSLNNHKSVRTLDKFLVRRVAKDPIVLGILAVLEHFGLKVQIARGKGVVQAVDACESLFVRNRGAQMLERVIRTLHSAWGDDPDAYHGQLIRGLGILFAKHANVDDDALARKLAAKSGPLSVLGKARDLRNALNLSVAQAVYEHVRNEYNKGRRTDRLEEKAA